MNARKKGILSQVVCYYKLKTQNVEGYFGSVLKLSIQMGVSERTLRRWFKELINLGLMYKDGAGYGLVSYDRLFSILGYRTQNRFKIFKIIAKYTANTSDLITAITKCEIRFNEAKQRYAINRKLRPKDRPDNNLDVNTDITLSCKGLSSLMGYSKTTGHRLEVKLKELYPNTVSIIRRVGFVKNLHPLLDANYVVPEGCYVEGGTVFRPMANLITIH